MFVFDSSMDDALLSNCCLIDGIFSFVYMLDYIMLEETKRVAESALRTRNQLCKNHYSYKLPYLLRSLQNAAYSRRTKLLYLPSGMLKRENNQSRYDNRYVHFIPSLILMIAFNF